MGCSLPRRMSVALLFTAALAGCGGSNSSATCRSTQAAPIEKHVHANGLQLFTSETCQVTTTPAGFVIEPSNKEELRYPFRVLIELLPARPRVTTYRVHYAGSGRILWYSATHAAAVGSGDPDWEVIAFEHVGDHWIQYREMKQDEGQPGELWELARGLSYISERRPR